ncbi:MAG: DNA polymerase IV [Acutalibacteraceae bacterium]|nr:DNA polymerase IV [Acutalibacteraceae bacterium]
MPALSRTILHSDCNAFYASVECLINPRLQSYCVAVCGDVQARHGIILAKNQNAKEFGVKTGEPIWMAKKKCPQLVTVQADFARYLEFAKRVREIYLEYTDRVEPFGLDEAWLDVTGSARLFGSGKAIAEEIRRRVREEIGITVSIGVSFNKIFAKLGSDYQKPDAVTVISRDNFREIVWPLPSGELLYVGPATKKKLAAMGIYTIGDVARCRQELLRGNLGKWGDWLYTFANGLDASPVARYSEIPPPKSIGNSVTAPRDLKTLDDVKIIFSVLCDSVCRRMREQGLRCKTVSIHIRDNELHTLARQCRLDRDSSITKDITDASMRLFQEHYHKKQAIRSLGVSVSDFTRYAQGVQLSFFGGDEKERVRREQLDDTVDHLKERFGACAICPALLLKDRLLSGFDPKSDHIIHPVGYSF